MFLNRSVPGAITVYCWGCCGGARVGDGMDLLELGVIAGVIAVVVYWVIVLPARQRKRRERERARMNQTHSGPRQPWDPDLTRGRRNR